MSRLSDDMDDLGLACREIETAIGEAASVEAPLRRALALSGHERSALGDLSEFKSVLYAIQKALKARLEEASGLVARVEYNPPEEENDNA